MVSMTKESPNMFKVANKDKRTTPSGFISVSLLLTLITSSDILSDILI